MAEVRDVLVPDIGDFADVPIIEVLVQPGGVVAPEDPIVTLESDKATMDVPAPFGGVVQDVKVSIGDPVSEGSPLVSVLPGEPDAEQGTEALTEPADQEATAAAD